jgi:hypothetical protein
MLDKIFPNQATTNEQNDNTLFLLPALLGVSLIVPAVGILSLLYLSRSRQKKAVPDNTSLTDVTRQDEERLAPLPSIGLPQEFDVMHGLSSLDFSPTLEAADKKSVWVRYYNLSKNGLYQVAAAILVEIASGEDHKSDHWRGETEEADELEIILARYNVCQYQPGCWMHQDGIAVEKEREILEREASAAVIEFTNSTSIPVWRLKPFFLSLADRGRGVIEFEIGVDVFTVNNFGEDDSEMGGEVQLPQGIWRYSPGMRPGHNGFEPAEHQRLCQELMARVIKATRNYILATGNTVSAIGFLPKLTDQAEGTGAAVAFEYEDEVWIYPGYSLEEEVAEEEKEKAAADTALSGEVVGQDSLPPEALVSAVDLAAPAEIGQEAGAAERIVADVAAEVNTAEVAPPITTAAPATKLPVLKKIN